MCDPVFFRHMAPPMSGPQALSSGKDTSYSSPALYYQERAAFLSIPSIDTRPFRSSRYVSRLLSLFEQEETIESDGKLKILRKNKSTAFRVFFLPDFFRNFYHTKVYLSKSHGNQRDDECGWSIEIWINVAWKAIIKPNGNYRSLPIRRFLSIGVVRHRSFNHLAETDCAFEHFLPHILKTAIHLTIARKFYRRTRVSCFRVLFKSKTRESTS